MLNNNKRIFEEGKEYLLSFSEIDINILNNQLEFPEKNKPRTIKGLFKKMIEHSKNRQGMPNSIGDVDKLVKILYDFDPIAVLQEFKNWELLFDYINKNYKTPGRMEKSNSHNYWVIFCKSIISIANYLSKFNNIDDFNKYVFQFINSNSDIRLSLPLILKEEIFGYQFALSCDFIKENISPEFIKPDVHIRDIFVGIGISHDNITDYQLFRDVINFSKSISEVPYTVDKLFWLIGSGNFYNYNIKINTNKKFFIEKIRCKTGTAHNKR